MSIPVLHRRGDLYRSIPEVILVTESRGREVFADSWKLMNRLDELGQDETPILAMTIKGRKLEPASLSGLNIYLRLNHGLSTFRRICGRGMLTTKWGWEKLAETLGLELTLS